MVIWNNEGNLILFCLKYPITIISPEFRLSSINWFNKNSLISASYMLKISLNKLLNIKSQLTVLTEINNNDRVFIPRSISKHLPIYFAIDNTDLKIDTPDGRNQLHGTAIAVYQKTETSEVLRHVSIDRQSKPKKLTRPIYSIQYW